jgi:hypothetical protein
VEKQPCVLEVLADPSTSYWLRDALKSAFQRDPVDALADAELLTALLSQRLVEVTANSLQADAGLH